MKIVNVHTPEPTPPPQRTFTIEFTEAELSALAILLGVMSQEKWNLLLRGSYDTTVIPDWGDSWNQYHGISEALKEGSCPGSYTKLTLSSN